MEKKIKHRIPEIARISSKGQMVIPKIFRNALQLKPGAPIAVDMHKGMLIMKPVKSPIDEEDFRILEEVGKAWEEIERGEYERARAEDFLREIKKW
ncbi:MAG: AbrB/MazE/SpoVT family DNA-binding domain-containing protein [Candidatus Hydrothermarchaeota archaeon]|nr:AbrB/MazE/SpoVT family DNA-binding domain-containing protein [Candidatus Hydrothermarchaeota archaeon]